MEADITLHKTPNWIPNRFVISLGAHLPVGAQKTLELNICFNLPLALGII